MPHRMLPAFMCVLLLATSICAQEQPPAPSDVVADVVDATNGLLETLDDAQKQAVMFGFDDDTQRRRWSNLPVSMVERRGLRMGDLNDAQKDAVMAVLHATLSDRGYQQVIDNINGDEVLRGNGRPGGPPFGKDEFYFSILGTPSATTPWMWQFGGHHLAVNATIVGENITLSPTLTGGQPARYELAGRQVRLLQDEIDKAHAFLDALTEEQREQAVAGDRPVNLLFGPNATRIQPMAEGVAVGKLSADQKELLLALIEERIGILNPTHAKLAMDRIRENLDGTYFAWFGSAAPGGAASFRVQGPAVIMEYAPQGMGANSIDHLHAMYRDPGNDYGVAWTAQQR